MMIFRITVLILVLSIVTWIGLKVLKKPVHFAIVMLGWIGFFLLATGLFYGMSILIANSNNF